MQTTKATPVRTGHSFNLDLPTGTLYIVATNRVGNLNAALGTVRPGSVVQVWRRMPEFDECLFRVEVPARSVYEPQTRNKIGGLGAWRDVVDTARRDAAIEQAHAFCAQIQ